LGTIHDVEALGDSWSMSTVIQRLLASHWPHLSLVLEWFGGIMLHVNLQGNCTKWLVNPLHLANGDHALWEPHFSSSMLSLHSNDFSPIQGPTSTAVLSQPTCTGQSFWARTVGFTSSGQILSFALALEVGALAFLVNAFLHGDAIDAFGLIGLHHISKTLRVRCHLGFTSTTSLLWAVHLSWACWSLDGPHHSVLSLLSLGGDVSPISRSIPTTDLTHHHVAVGPLGFWGTHRGSTLLIGAVSTPFGCLGDTLHESLRQQVGIACFGLASLVLIVGQHMLSMPSSGFVHFSVSTGNALCSHHQSIASALSVGSFVHLALFSLREGSKQVLAFKASPASHLSWVTLWLGFHLLDTCVHSDAVNAFGTADTALLIQPNLATSVQSSTRQQGGFVESLYSVCSHLSLDSHNRPDTPSRSCWAIRLLGTHRCSTLLIGAVSTPFGCLGDAERCLRCLWLTSPCRQETVSAQLL